MYRLLSAAALLAVVVQAQIDTTPLQKNGTVYMLALVPQNGTNIGPMCRESMQIVIDRVNANPNILPNHKIDIAYGNDQCDPEVGMSEYFRLVRLNRPASAVMLGSMCDSVCESVGVLPHIWSMIEVAAGCGTPVISPGPLYLSFHRVATPQDLFSRVRFWFFKQMNWKKVAVITEMFEILSRDAINFVKAATTEQIQITTTEFYIYNIADKVNNLKKKDSRIILLNCGQTTCTQFFCEAYKIGLYGPKIVFILNNWIRLNATDMPTDCQAKDIEMVMEGSLFMGTLRDANEDSMLTTLNYTVGEFNRELGNRLKGYNDTEGWGNRTLCHDAALFGAHVMHEAEIAMRMANRSLSSFSSKDASVLPFIMNSTSRVRVVGLRGLLAISPVFRQEMLTPMEVAQKKGDRVVRAHLFYPNGDRAPQNFEPLKWKTRDGKPPRDSTTVFMRRTSLAPWLYSLMAALAAFGIAMAVLFAIMNFARRHARAIKMSSPKMNNLILYGSILMLITVIVYPIEQTEKVWEYCVARLVTFITGFCMLFGSMFAKAWRVHQIFVKVIQRAEAVKDHRLMMFVACWVGVNWIIIAVWFGFDLMRAEKVNTTIEVNETDADTIYQNWYFECTSDYQMYFSAAIAVIQGLLLFLGGFLAYETRKVHIEELNDSQSIGLCIYNIVVLAIVAVIAMFSAGDNLDLGYGIISGVILAGTLLAIFVIFLPKCPVYFGLAKAVDDVSVAPSKDTLGTGGGTRTTGTTSNEPHNVSTGQSGPK